MMTHISNLKRMTKHNESFRRVVATGSAMQVTMMVLAPGEDIGEEVHAGDQLFYAIDGAGEIVVDGFTESFEKNDAVLVVSGARHNVRASEDDELKFISVSATSRYPHGADHETKEAAMTAEAQAEAVTRVPSAL